MSMLGVSHEQNYSLSSEAYDKGALVYFQASAVPLADDGKF